MCPFDEIVVTSEDGNSVVLTCITCDYAYEIIDISTQAPTGTHWCPGCGDFGFDFDIVGLTAEQIAALNIPFDPGPLGPDGPTGAVPLSLHGPRGKIL